MLQTFQNPVYPSCFADPFCFFHKGVYYAVGTGKDEADACPLTAPDGRDYAIYHAWGARMTERQLWIDPLEWTERGPRVERFADSIARRTAAGCGAPVYAHFLPRASRFAWARSSGSMTG